MKKKGEKFMPTKKLSKEEILPANNLRTISQKALIEKAKKVDKLGIFSNNDLSLAMLDWEKYESIVELIEEQQKLIAHYENLFEDYYLAQKYGEEILKIEEGKAELLEVDNIDDVFGMLEEQRG